MVISPALYRTRIRPALFALNPEWVHDTLQSLGSMLGQSSGLLSWVAQATKAAHDVPDAMAQTLWGQRFAHPIGLAAGFDKNARLLPLMQALGMAHIEVGSMSALPAKGNPKPRLFRLPHDEALINRMGLNNWGAHRIAASLERLLTLNSTITVPLTINLVKTHNPAILGSAALDDFATSYRYLAPYAGMVTLNISCPNTTEGKTFEDPDALRELLTRLDDIHLLDAHANSVAHPPWGIKCSPDLSLSELDQLMAVAHQFPRVQGWVMSNTSVNRKGLTTPSHQLERYGVGGVSGKPLFQPLLTRVSHVAQHSPLPIIAVGGIHSAESAWQAICHGASLIQVYTALVYEGPGLMADWVPTLHQRMQDEGFTQLSHAVGSALASPIALTKS